ncbi:DUF922 domain-containing protein [Sorangium sp. So ce136]|uniref:DUF922 domain-containing protein n=1 Tax=Sorangium sp. So ce136 TaxID=3133284 RepID=UPI003F01BF69
MRETCTSGSVRAPGRRRPGATRPLDVVLVLPRWRPPPNAAPALVATWEAELRALVAHEEGHRDLAIAAGAAVAEALETTPPAASAEALDEAMMTRAEAALAAARERAYDQATAHGARWPAA